MAVVNKIEVVCTPVSASVAEVVFDDGVATHIKNPVSVDAAAVGITAVAGESTAVNIDCTVVGDGTTVVLGGAVAGEGAAIDGQHGTIIIINSTTVS